MKFSYFKIPTLDPKRKWISRPIIPVTLFGPQGKIIVDALIDSGADKSLFHVELAQEIGLNLKIKRSEFFGGIEGGRVKSFLSPIRLQIMGMDEIIEIMAGFTSARGVSAILGQEGFFDAFKIKFERRRNRIEIILEKSK